MVLISIKFGIKNSENNFLDNNIAGPLLDPQGDYAQNNAQV